MFRVQLISKLFLRNCKKPKHPYHFQPLVESQNATYSKYSVKMWENMKLISDTINNGAKTNERVLADGLRFCLEDRCPMFGKSLHGHILKGGYEDFGIVGIFLFDFYRRCLAMESAFKVFLESQSPEIFIVRFYPFPLFSYLILSNRVNEALHIFLKTDICWDDQVELIEDCEDCIALKLVVLMGKIYQGYPFVTLKVAVNICTRMKYLKLGMMVHCLLITGGYAADFSEELIYFYSKFRETYHYMERVYCGLSPPCWEATGLDETGEICLDDTGDFIRLVYAFADLHGTSFWRPKWPDMKRVADMLNNGAKPNEWLLADGLRFCSFWCKMFGKSLHGQILKGGYEGFETVGKNLFDFYNGFHAKEDACKVFIESQSPQFFIMWFYPYPLFLYLIQCDKGSQAFDIFVKTEICRDDRVNLIKKCEIYRPPMALKMVAFMGKIDQGYPYVTLEVALSACTTMKYLKLGMMVHCLLITGGYAADFFEELIDFYSQFRKTFDYMERVYCGRSPPPCWETACLDKMGETIRFVYRFEAMRQRTKIPEPQVVVKAGDKLAAY